MTEELIERFFNKQCSPQEADEVAEYLKNHPDLLEKYLGSGEWATAQSKSMPQSFWNAQWLAITRKRSAFPSIAWIKRASVAAILLLSAGLIYINLHPDKKSVAAHVSKFPSSATEQKVTVNNSNKTMQIMLPDSSEIRLSPGSVIAYTTPFSGKTRDITLEGESWFRVKKNEKKPFTVYAGGLATTALGTEFTIDARRNVRVQLHNGKVLVTAVGEALRHWKKNVILEPGQQLVYDNATHQSFVNPIGQDYLTLKTEKPKKIRKSISETSPGLDFLNTSLPDVMTRLSGHYHEKIMYNRAEIRRMNFTGTISSSDSLSTVLKIIAQMNDLELSRDDTGYILKKADK